MLEVIRLEQNWNAPCLMDLLSTTGGDGPRDSEGRPPASATTMSSGGNKVHAAFMNKTPWVNMASRRASARWVRARVALLPHPKFGRTEPNLAECPKFAESVPNGAKFGRIVEPQANGIERASQILSERSHTPRPIRAQLRSSRTRTHKQPSVGRFHSPTWPNAPHTSSTTPPSCSNPLHGRTSHKFGRRS